MEDQQILDLYGQRSDDAISETARKYGAYCFAVANRILQNPEDAEECVNDTWLHAWNAIPPAKPRVLRMFLAKITRNLACDRFSARMAEKRGGGEIALVLDELAECLPARTDVEAACEQRELAQCIRRFARSLPEREGNVFLRRYFFTDSVAEIAARYGMRENSVMVSLSRTRKKLRAHLKKEGLL